MERRQALEQEIAELREKSAGMKARWQSEKQAIEGIRKRKAEVEAAFDSLVRMSALTDASRDYQRALANMRIAARDFASRPTEQQVKAFEEAKALAGLYHPNVANIIDRGVSSNDRFVETEAGDDAAELIPLPLPRPRRTAVPVPRPRPRIDDQADAPPPRERTFFDMLVGR